MCSNTSSNFLINWQNNKDYFDRLAFIASLSNLFSDNTIPYLDYRIAENLFCKYYNAQNNARACTAYDAILDKLGIGIKTFILNKDTSLEKIAEFNKLKKELDKHTGFDLAIKLAEFRNNRIDFANNLYGITNAIYHIVGRTHKTLQIFNTPYTKINLNNIRVIKDDVKSIHFEDGKDNYSFNKSKSVLQKRFQANPHIITIPINIIDNPLEILYNATLKHKTQIINFTPKIKGIDYVILPLYSRRNNINSVPTKSGLNQWNAGGRKRNENEVYIPVPIKIHKLYPSFFPTRDKPFELLLPDGVKLSAKICQDGNKALMSNPNSALGEWLLRKVMKKPIGELVTIEDLYRLGIDSVIIEDLHYLNNFGEKVYSITFQETTEDSYAKFIGD